MMEFGVLASGRHIVPRVFVFLIALALCQAITSQSKAEPMQFDIVINGGSFSSPAAALQAARSNPASEILLLEPTDWLGGQATSQGVAAIDNSHHAPASGLMSGNEELYYPADYLDFLARLEDPPAEAPGLGFGPPWTSWVSRDVFDPRTAAWILEQMIAEQPNITLMKMAVVKGVETVDVNDADGAGKKIIGLTVIERTPVGGYTPFDDFLSEEIEDWYTADDSARFTKAVHVITPRDGGKGMVVIDASENADVVVLSGADYTVGRESTTEKINEDGSLPAYDEGGTQAFVYPFCMTDAETPSAESELKTDWADFNTYYADQVANYFSIGGWSWLKVFTYRRLYTSGPYDSNVITRGDVSMQNWYPGNDYPYMSMWKDKAAAAAEAADWKGGVIPAALDEAEKHALAWYFWMKENRTTAWDTRYLRGDDEKNMMGSKHGLAKFPYIRGTRRIVGLDSFRLMGRYFVNAQVETWTTSFRFYDSLGIGNYAVDIHPSRASTGISPQFGSAAPFYIPFRSLASNNVRNLLVGGKIIAGTYISNAAYRLHPIEWAIGSGAGGAAAAMAEDGSTNYDLLDLIRLREIQTEVNVNSPIYWDAFDEDIYPDRPGDLVVNDLNAVGAGQSIFIEVYHRTAHRAEIYQEEELLGETTVRALGRLTLTADAANGSQNFTAYLYNEAGSEIGIIRNFVAPDPDDLTIIDNDDDRFSVTGEWMQADAQPNKYGPSYHYKFANSGYGEATWNIYTPEAGMYEIAIWYPESFNRAVDAPFTIHHADGEELFLVNQRENGGQWNVLGTFRFENDEDSKVVLTTAIADSEKLVVADAVRARRIVTDGWIIF